MGWMILEDEKNNEVGKCGDEAWDLATSFVDEMNKLWLKTFGRDVQLNEINHAVEFVYGANVQFKAEMESMDKSVSA